MAIATTAAVAAGLLLGAAVSVRYRDEIGFLLRRYVIAWRGLPPPEAVPGYRERTGIFAISARRADIVMLGDSLTAAVEWAEMFPERIIVNRGVAGDTLAGMRARLASVMAPRPHTVVVLAGSNDIGLMRPVAEIAADFRALVNDLLAAGVRVVVISTLPVGLSYRGMLTPATFNAHVRDLNSRLVAEFRQQSRVRFIDLASELGPNGMLEDRFTTDGSHLTATAYRLWCNRLSAEFAARPPP
jgi:lysophospholipase L1-like esterase